MLFNKKLKARIEVLETAIATAILGLDEQQALVRKAQNATPDGSIVVADNLFDSQMQSQYLKIYLDTVLYIDDEDKLK